VEAGGAGSGYTGSQHSRSGNSLARIRHTATAKRPSPRKKLSTVNFLIRGSIMGGHWANTRPPILPTPNQIFGKNTVASLTVLEQVRQTTTQNFPSAHVHLHVVLPLTLDITRTEFCKVVLAVTTSRRNRDLSLSLTISTRELLSQTWMGRQCHTRGQAKALPTAANQWKETAHAFYDTALRRRSQSLGHDAKRRFDSSNKTTHTHTLFLSLSLSLSLPTSTNFSTQL